MHLLEPAWESLKREFDAACLQSAHAVRGQMAHELNQFVRRLRQYRTEAEWVSGVLSEAGKFAGRLGVFFLDQSIVRLRGQQNLGLPDACAFPLSSAAAFVSAVETKDPVVALRSSGEVSSQLSSPNPSDRAHLFPVTNGARVAAVIFTDTEHVDIDGLELVAGIGSLVLERQSNVSLHAQIAPVQPPANQPEIGTAPRTGPSASDGVRSSPSRPQVLPAWAALNEPDRSLHLRAQRFSRVSVAEMQLSRPEACRAGRETWNLYVFLRTELDKTRDLYRKQFMTIPSMIDYLHLELVRSAAEGDDLKLGAEYPGPLA
jgi:hypothetical protein